MRLQQLSTCKVRDLVFDDSCGYASWCDEVVHASTNSDSFKKFIVPAQFEVQLGLVIYCLCSFMSSSSLWNFSISGIFSMLYAARPLSWHFILKCPAGEGKNSRRLLPLQYHITVLLIS